MLASHHLPHHEPISFGIDQILSCPEPTGSGLGPGRAGQGHGEGAAFSGAFHGASSYCPSGSLGPLPSSSGLGPGGVIRVPAHRPLPVPPPAGSAPAVPGPSGLGGTGGLAGLTFPWMDSGRRFAKDRLTGEDVQPLRRSVPPGPGVLISDPWGPDPGGLSCASLGSFRGIPSQRTCPGPGAAGMGDELPSVPAPCSAGPCPRRGESRG